MNRLEHAPSGTSRYHKIRHDAAAIEGLFVDLFLETHKTPPREIILDLDATDDPVHGHQEGRFFHGYYDCHCYLPLYVFCGKHLLAAKLRRANIDASAGAVEEIERIVAQIRARWPRIEILLRADAGFARDALMSWCEANRVDYVFGLARNERLVGAIADALALAAAESLAQAAPARRFADFAWRTLDSWSRTRRVVAKAEHLPKGANPRFVVTSLAADQIDARTCTRTSTAPAATSKTGSRSSSSICSPIAHRPPPCVPISCACGSRRSPTSCSTRCAGSGSGTPSWPAPPVAPSGSGSSRSAGAHQRAAYQGRHGLSLPVPGRVPPGVSLSAPRRLLSASASLPPPVPRARRRTPQTHLNQQPGAATPRPRLRHPL